MQVGYVTMRDGKVYGDYPDIYSIDPRNNERVKFNSCFQFIEITYNFTGSLVHPEYKTKIIDINDVWLIGYYSDSKRLYTNPEGKMGRN